MRHTASRHVLWLELTADELAGVRALAKLEQCAVPNLLRRALNDVLVDAGLDKEFPLLAERARTPRRNDTNPRCPCSEVRADKFAPTNHYCCRTCNAAYQQRRRADKKRPITPNPERKDFSTG